MVKQFVMVGANVIIQQDLVFVILDLKELIVKVSLKKNNYYLVCAASKICRYIMSW